MLQTIVDDTSKSTEEKVKIFEEQVNIYFQKDKVAKQKVIEEEKKQANLKEDDSKWTKEDIANLTKAIVRFPPGTSARWKTITDYIGGKTQKDVIKKAKELADKRGNETKSRQEATKNA